MTSVPNEVHLFATALGKDWLSSLTLLVSTTVRLAGGDATRAVLLYLVSEAEKCQQDQVHFPGCGCKEGNA